VLRFTRRDNPHMLTIGMTGVKLGDRLLQIGCADGGRLAALAAKVGLSGRAVVVASDESEAARATKGAAAAGVLIEVEVRRASSLAFADGDFDLAVVDDTGALLARLSEDDRAGMVQELFRVLRPGGRAMVIGAGVRSGLGALLTKSPVGSGLDAAALLQSGPFRSVRTLAEREGLTFVEGLKPRT
jgi:ubiquinone/menaquinone biosynthesis C-methylase UbiE